MEKLVRFHVRLEQKETEEPVTGDEYIVKFYDKDIITDDYLGESSLDDYGHAIVVVSKSDFRSADSPLEVFPDIYFSVYKNDEIIYESPVGSNLKLEEAGDYPATSVLHFNLGTFRI